MKPNLVLDFVVQEGKVFFCMRNLSKHPATNLSFKFSQPLMARNGYLRVDKLPLFKHLDYFAPKKEIRLFVDSVTSFLAHHPERKMTIHVKYVDQDSKKYVQSFKHDLELFNQLPLGTFIDFI